MSGAWQVTGPIALVRSLAKNAASLAGIEVVRKHAYEAMLKRYHDEIQGLNKEAESLRQEITKLHKEAEMLREEPQFLRAAIVEYQLKLERKPDYQSIMAQDQIRAGMANLESDFLDFYLQCREYTMTSWERLYALHKAVLYVLANEIRGDFVECGVWRGGSMRLVAMTLMAKGVKDRTLYLYDTFEGMTKPGELDVDLHGSRAVDDWTQIERRGVKWAYAPIEEVREAIASTGYPMDKVILVKGPVETTIPGTIPERIALLRLDTDWYESTKHEIEHLYPRLSAEGVLAIDDYGHYRGSRQAIDEYFSGARRKPLLQRTDYACRFAVKPRN
jgi:O-methyltransferase